MPHFSCTIRQTRHPEHGDLPIRVYWDNWNPPVDYYYEIPEGDYTWERITPDWGTYKPPLSAIH